VAFASPRLSAALVLWSLTEWRADDPDAHWFRMSAAQLQYRQPWLFASAPREIVAAELQRQAASFLPPNEQMAVTAAWVELIRSGEVLRLLFEALSPIPHLDLVRCVTAKEVAGHELLWQANALAIAVKAYRREGAVNAEVRMLGGAAPRRFKGDHLVPLRDLLAGKVVELPPLARDAIGRLIEAATAVGRIAGDS
jgi:hypothetical protein